MHRAAWKLTFNGSSWTVFQRVVRISRSTRNGLLLDHSVGAHQQGLRERKPDRLCRIEVDNELELRRLHNWKISGIGNRDAVRVWRVKVGTIVSDAQFLLNPPISFLPITEQR